jgi:hypothetical protein
MQLIQQQAKLELKMIADVKHTLRSSENKSNMKQAHESGQTSSAQMRPNPEDTLCSMGLE